MLPVRVLVLALVVCAIISNVQAGEGSGNASPAIDSGPTASQIVAVPKPPSSRWKAIWVGSVALEGIGSAFDGYTSYHRGPYESDALLRDSDGQFGTKGVIVKAAFFAGFTAGQWLIIHKWPKTAKLFAPANAALSGLYFRAGFQNEAFLSSH